MNRFEVFMCQLLPCVFIVLALILGGLWAALAVAGVIIGIGVYYERLNGEPAGNPESAARRIYLKENGLPPDPIVIPQGIKGFIKQTEGFWLPSFGFGLVYAPLLSVNYGILVSICVAISMIAAMIAVYRISVTTEDVIIHPKYH